jgi:hypothetical protein
MYDADVLVIKTLEGQIVTSEKWSGRTLDVRRIPNGMYTLHSLNRKGVTHRIGTFVLNHSQY